MDQQTLFIILGVIALLLVAAVLLLRARTQHVRLSDVAPPPPRPVARPPEPERARVAPTDEEAQIISAAAVANAPLEVVAEPAATEAPALGDPLTRIKGLGPKAATRLGELGITRFDQIAGWSEAQADAIDAQMGPFRGRIRRDRWIEQARLLAANDVATFEAQFGKLGG